MAKTRNEVIEEFTKLEGVTSSIAEALYNGGYTTTEKLKSATIGEMSKIDGIHKSMARSIHRQLNPDSKADDEPKAGGAKEAPKKPKAEHKAAAKEGEGKKIEAKKEEPKVEIVEEGAAGYKPRAKPELSAEKKRFLAVRAEIKDKTPVFKRQEWFSRQRVGDSWRKPKGRHSKRRQHWNSRVNIVSIGYGTPAATRGLHSSGFEEVLVHNVSELENIEPKTQAARIARGVGGKKRSLMFDKADELGIRILNRRM